MTLSRWVLRVGSAFEVRPTPNAVSSRYRTGELALFLRGGSATLWRLGLTAEVPLRPDGLAWDLRLLAPFWYRVVPFCLQRLGQRPVASARAVSKLRPGLFIGSPVDRCMDGSLAQ